MLPLRALLANWEGCKSAHTSLSSPCGINTIFCHVFLVFYLLVDGVLLLNSSALEIWCLCSRTRSLVFDFSICRQHTYITWECYDVFYVPTCRNIILHKVMQIFIESKWNLYNGSTRMTLTYMTSVVYLCDDLTCHINIMFIDLLSLAQGYWWKW